MESPTLAGVCNRPYATRTKTIKTETPTLARVCNQKTVESFFDYYPTRNLQGKVGLIKICHKYLR